MKKILYSLMAFAGLFTTSCISFDDPVTEYYGEGPVAQINVTEITDSAFTFTVNPGENALYYSILVDQSADTVAVDAENLLKGAYASVFNVVTNTKEAATFTFNMRGEDGAPLAQPGKTYQIYAVAATDKGVYGKVNVVTAVTTDGLAPKPVDYADDEQSMYVLFSENVTRGEGAITVTSYKHYDLVAGKFAGEQVPAEEIEVVVEDDIIAILAPTTAPGAYLAFSWEAGAFMDEAGHPCSALTSGFSPAQGDFVGLITRNEFVSFAVDSVNVAEPALGSVIDKASSFFATLSFDHNIYANTKTGVVSLTYSNATTQTTVKLKYGEEWDADGNEFYFILPENNQPKPGDVISFTLGAGTFTDVYGNPNAATTYEGAWTMSTGITLTEADFNGTFAAAGISAYDEAVVDLGQNIYVYSLPELDERVPAGCKAVGVENLILEGSAILGYYNIEKGILAVGAFYEVGTVEMKDGTVYGSITYSLAGNDWIEFKINEEGVFETNDLAWVACDINYTEAKGFLDKFTVAQMVKMGELPAQAPALKKKFEIAPANFKVANSLPRLKK